MADVHFPLGVPLCFLHLPRASHTQPVMHACRLSGKGFTDMTLRAADEAQNPMVHCSGGVGTLELGRRHGRRAKPSFETQAKCCMGTGVALP